MHVDHEHAAAAVPRRASPALNADACRDCYTDPTVWDGFDPKLMTLCSPDPQAFRPPEEKVNVLQVRLPTNFKAARFDVGRAHRDPAPARGGHRGGALRRRRRKDRAAGEAQGARLDLRAAREVGDAARRQLPLRAARTACARSRTRCTATSTPRARSTTGWSTLCVSLGADREGPGAVREVRQRGAVAAAARPPRRARSPPARPTSSASTAWCRPSPRRRACATTVVDETVALVDGWLERNRKKAA